MLLFTALALLSYVLGSANTAIFICRWWGLPDPRTQGSGNPGFNNVLRFAGKAPALLVLLGEIAKIAIPILLAKYGQLSLSAQSYIGLCGVLGQMFPLFFRFRGGKGVAATLGCILAIAWPLGLFALAMWCACAALFRIASLASMLAVWSVALTAAWFFPPLLLPLSTMSVLITWRHRANILRLREGTEPRIVFGKK